ncbi:hypothetical protein MMC22_000387 [Lobaria immixta]|nr:hypothetical protein [Lobaria immixta]
MISHEEATSAVGFVVGARSTGESLNVSKLFTSLSLTIVLLSQTLVSLLQVIPLYLATLSCFQRISEFLSADLQPDPRIYQGATSEYQLRPWSSNQEAISKSRADYQSSSNAFVIEDGYFVWSRQGEILKKIIISIPRSKLTFIVGLVASGKSTLCKELLGETSNSKGYIQLNEPSPEIAFCDQTPHLINTTIRRNIAGSSPFDVGWYNTVIQATTLTNDFASLPKGDQQLVGSNGVNLSGGQKRKVAIARAVYARKKFAAFEYVFSGLDATSEKHVFDHVLAQKDSSGYLPFGDHIVVLGSRGNVVEQETFQSVRGISTPFLTQKDLTSSAENGVAEQKTLGPQSSGVKIVLEDKSRQLREFSIYKYYFRAFTFPCLWLKWWTDAIARHGNQKDSMYLGVYALFQSLALLFLFVFALHGFTTVVARSGTTMHNITLQAVMHAPNGFFQQHRHRQYYQQVLAGLPFHRWRVTTRKNVSPLEVHEPRGEDPAVLTKPSTHFLETLSGISTIRAFG